MIIGSTLLASLKDRLNSRGVLQQITNGFTWGIPQSGTNPPYGVVNNLAEAPKVDTNTSRVRRVMWTVNLYVNNPPEDGAVLAKAVSDAITFAPLIVTPGVVLLVEDPAVRWLEEDYFWNVAMDFIATVSQPANYMPV